MMKGHMQLRKVFEWMLVLPGVWLNGYKSKKSTGMPSRFQVKGKMSSHLERGFQSPDYRT